MLTWLVKCLPLICVHISYHLLETMVLCLCTLTFTSTTDWFFLPPGQLCLKEMLVGLNLQRSMYLPCWSCRWTCCDLYMSLWSSWPGRRRPPSLLWSAAAGSGLTWQNEDPWTKQTRTAKVRRLRGRANQHHPGQSHKLIFVHTRTHFGSILSCSTNIFGTKETWSALTLWIHTGEMTQIEHMSHVQLTFSWAYLPFVISSAVSSADC